MMKSVDAIRTAAEKAEAAEARGLTWEERAEKEMEEMDDEE